MKITGPGKRLTVYFGESDQWRGQALYKVLLETLKREGLAGASVTRCVAGFGAHSRIRTAAIESLSTDLPMILEVIDRPEKINTALALIGPMIREGLITVEDLFIASYTHRHLHPIPGDKLVGEVMTREVEAVGPETPIADVMDQLIGQRFKSVPVVDASRKVLGIIGDGALIARGGMNFHLSVAERLNRETITRELNEMRQSNKIASDVMTSPVTTIPESMSLAHAASVLTKEHLQRLPVLDATGRLAGMLSRLDILRTVVSSGASSPPSAIPPGAGQTIGEVMNPKVPMVSLDAGLVEVVEVMLSSDCKRVVVVDGEGKAAGIINDGDLVERVEAGARPGLINRLMGRGGLSTLPNMSAAEIMTPSVLTGATSTTITDAIQMMLEQKRKRLIVVDDQGRPIGLVDRQMILHAIMGLE